MCTTPCDCVSLCLYIHTYNSARFMICRNRQLEALRCRSRTASLPLAVHPRSQTPSPKPKRCNYQIAIPEILRLTRKANKI